MPPLISSCSTCRVAAAAGHDPDHEEPGASDTARRGNVEMGQGPHVQSAPVNAEFIQG
jgi:hypothetical protein